MALLKIIKVFFLAIYKDVRQTDKIYHELRKIIMPQPSDEVLHAAAVKYAKANGMTVAYALHSIKSVISSFGSGFGITAEELAKINRELKGE